MTRESLTTVIVTLLIVGETAGAFPADAKAIGRQLTPLPQRLSVSEAVERSPAAIGVEAFGALGVAGDFGVTELKKSLKEKTGVVPNGQGFFFRFRLVPNDPELVQLPNAAQAYRIVPDGTTALNVDALDGCGVFYACQTLRQLVTATPEKVVIPLANILDWPDFDERGLWNQPNDTAFLEWMASLKLNHGRVFCRPAPIKKGAINSITFDAEKYRWARQSALNLMPDITHLNFLHTYGLFDAYPELKGQGAEADAGSYFAHGKGNYSHPVPCASNPLLAKILTEWMEDFAQKGVNEIGCWLTERPAQCQCDKCLEAGQFVREAEAFIQAWKNVRKQYPDFTIRLFISTTTDEEYYKILAALPKGVRIERACAAEQGRVRHSPRDLFRNPLFDAYAKQGVWMASYDAPINVNGAVETPEFKLPECSAERVKDFVEQLHDRGYQGVYGMMAWRNFCREICGYNIAALAEWSWNVKGRSPREFALAWATREGLAPEAFAEWAALMGPIEFDVYDSDLPECYTRGKAVEMIKKKLYPELGGGMFRYYASPESFGAKIRDCEKALKIAETLKDPSYALETRVVMSYAKLAGSVYRIALANRRGNKTELTVGLGALRQAEVENSAAIKAWRTRLGSDPWHHRVNDAIEATRNTVSRISEIIKNGDSSRENVK